MSEFDIISYLESKDIEFWDSGKNVTQGWINIRCVFPHCDDHSNHLGISPDRFFNCYICSETGHVTKVVREIEQCSWDRAEKIVKSFREDDLPQSFDNLPQAKINDCILPKGISKNFNDLYKQYFKKRNYNLNYLIHKYDLYEGGIIGDYKFRIIIPFYLDNELITFSSLDITGKQELKHKHNPDDNAIIPIKHTIYGIDSCTNEMILVESCTDKWNMGNGSGSTSGKKVTHEQINLIVGKGIKKVLLIPDSDSIWEWEKVGNKLSGLVCSVEMIELETGDPADLSEDMVKRIRNDFFKKGD
ncbi:hypothetical protein LCGC14_0458610 [marine sediment metagenome]|uniref:Zinc finger CHC2-type domain-containing protein n=1 Tax=marine sediment metagenome TaxID=412755 RepID=A0A0F9VPJ3_9ZZZZ